MVEETLCHMYFTQAHVTFHNRKKLESALLSAYFLNVQSVVYKLSKLAPSHEMLGLKKLLKGAWSLQHVAMHCHVLVRVTDNKTKTKNSANFLF